MTWRLPRFERDDLTARLGSRWIHPELRREIEWPAAAAAGNVVSDLTDVDIPLADRLALRATVSEQNSAALEASEAETDAELREHGTWVEHHADAYGDIDPNDHEMPPVRMLVRRPRKASDNLLPCVFRISGGAMLFGDPREFRPWITETSRTQDAVVVSPWFRGSVEGAYPASINDLHAAFRWTVENAEELGIDPDRIVIVGVSGGGLLGLSLAFRLKRFGFRPRGCVVLEPITDDRMIYPSHRTGYLIWDGVSLPRAVKQYLGPDEFNSPYLGPEAVANRATVEDCVGLCPIFLHSVEHDPDRDPSRAFIGTLNEAGVYAELHQWGGAIHGQLYTADIGKPYKQRFDSIFQGNISDCLTYDLRRDWRNDEFDGEPADDFEALYVAREG